MSILSLKSATSVPVRAADGGRNAPFFTLQDEINQLFENFFHIGSRLPAMGDERVLGAPVPVDVTESEGGYKIKAEVPGMTAEQLTVTAGEGYVTLRGEKKAEKEEKGENYLRRESSYGAFQRTIPLPDTADFNAATADFKNGVLTIAMPKKAMAQSSEKKIAIKAA